MLVHKGGTFLFYIFQPNSYLFFFKFHFIGIYGRNVPLLKNYIERLCLKVESSFLNKLQKMFVHKGGTFLS